MIDYGKEAALRLDNFTNEIKMLECSLCVGMTAKKGFIVKNKKVQCITLIQHLSS